jgi:hypothetical protein
MTKLEEVADAIRKNAPGAALHMDLAWPQLPTAQRAYFCQVARAAIEALKEPSELLMDAAGIPRFYWTSDGRMARRTLGGEFDAVLDAVLKEGQ